MEEYQLLKTIKQLQQIKPNPDWVSFNKKQILEKEKSSRLNWLFFPITKPITRPALVFALRGVMVMVVILAGAFFYLYYLNSQIPQISLSDLFKNQGNEKLVASLEELQLKLEEINLSLANLRNAKNQRQALVMTEVVKGTISGSKEIVEGIKNQSHSNKISASLGKTVDILDEVGETSSNIGKEMIEQAIQYLETRTLSEQDKEFLERAKKCYKEGKEGEAVMWIDKIYNK